jgi:hypothetical protein
MVRGIEQENKTGRAPLPRTIHLWKDAEETGYDKLLLYEVKDQLQKAGSSIFFNKLKCGSFEPSDSKGNFLIQIADLFTSSVNRILNTYVDGTKPKDQFAKYFLELIGIDTTNERIENIGDLAVHIYL